MTKSAKSLLYFGIYVIIMGLLFLAIPAQIVSLLQLPTVPLNWARLIGLLVLVIGSYDAYSGYDNIQPFVKASVYIRLGFAVGTLLLFVFGQMPITILLVGGVDALSALWTMMALKSEGK